MRSPRLTMHEHAFLSSRNFHVYDDQVVDALRQWSIGSQMWEDSLHCLYSAGTTRELFAQHDEHLSQVRKDFGQRFAQALTTIAADSPIEDIAISTLQKLIHDDDHERRLRLRNWFTRIDLPQLSDAHAHDIAMAFADPHSRTIMPDNTYTVLTPDIMIESYLDHIDTQGDTIVGNLRHAYNTPPSSQKQSLGTAISGMIRHIRRKQT